MLFALSMVKGHHAVLYVQLEKNLMLNDLLLATNRTQGRKRIKIGPSSRICC